MDHLTTEARNPASAALDEMSPLELARLMNREDHTAVDAVGSQLEAIAKAIEIIAKCLTNGGRLIYAGAGTSGRLGVLDATECPPTFNTAPEMVVGLIAGGLPALTKAVEGAEDHPEQGRQDLQDVNFSSNDVLVGIATSGRTPYVIGAAVYARSLGATVIGFVCNADSELHSHCDLMIAPVVGPEILSGSTRLKAGTATKLVLNTLTTGAMVRMGKTFGNLMVDLRATNVKLKARTNRIVRILTSLNDADAAKLLDICNGELKTALVAELNSISPAAARSRIAEAGGAIRKALNPRPQAARSPRTDLVIGIDGGGTSTVALLATAHQIIGRGQAGPSNLHSVGRDRALHGLDDAIARAFQDAKLGRSPVRSICLGLAGADRAEEKALLKNWVADNRIADWCDVTSDGALLLAAGTPDGWGLAVISGTGSICVGRSPAGQFARAGGWGYLLGDEGSGYAMSMAALQQVTMAADGSADPTSLSGALLQAMELQKPIDVIRAVYGSKWDRTAIAGLAPVVFQCAGRGDAAANIIVSDSADKLAQTARAAAAKLGMMEENIPLALAGGVMLGSDLLRTRLLAALAKIGLKIGHVALVAQPAEGAVKLARAQQPLPV